MLRIHPSTNARPTLAILLFICALCFGPHQTLAAQVPLRASYSLELEADFSAFPLVGVTSHGSGLANQLGNFTSHSISETVDLSTGQGVAVHEFTAANGDTIQLTFHLVATPTSETSFSVEGVWQITDGAGRFAGATGKGSYQGTVQFTSATTATGAFELTGTISPVGAK
jgi:hypothetical protein